MQEFARKHCWKMYCTPSYLGYLDIICTNENKIFSFKMSRNLGMSKKGKKQVHCLHALAVIPK